MARQQPTRADVRLRLTRPENLIQRAVFEHLRVRSAPGVFAFHPANGGWRSPIEAAILKGLGVRAGVPDVIAVKDGRTYALELKPPGGRLNPHPTYRRLSRYDETGLIWLLQGCEVLALTATTAAIRHPGGSVTTYRKSNKPGFGPLGDSLEDFQ
jgi:hypothetical protein